MNKDKEVDFFSKYAHAAYDVFTERGYDRILKEFERVVQPKPGETLVDFGCGTGAFTKRLTRYRLNVLGVDISPECVRYASATVKGATFLVGDIENVVGIPSNSADIVVFSGVLHHFDDFTTTVKEAARVLKKGGRIFAYDPHKRNPAMWLYRDKKSPLHSTKGRTENERLLTREEIRDTLNKAGYSDIRVFPISGVSYRHVDGGGRSLLPLYNFFEELLGTLWIAKYWGSFLISSART